MVLKRKTVMRTMASLFLNCSNKTYFMQYYMDKFKVFHKD